MAATLALAFAASVLAQEGSVRARLGAASVPVDETVTLDIVARGVEGELDTRALERDFDIVGRASSREVEIVDGERRVTVQWTLELAPRAVGVFTVPSVAVGGVESELLTLTVTEAPTGGERRLFVEALVDTTTPWVQSQLLLTLRVYRAVEIIDGSLGEPYGEGLDIVRLGGDRDFTEERDGRRYAVVERRYALFPERSGPLVIEPVTLSVALPADPVRTRGFFAPTRRIRRRSEPIRLEVRARPPSGRGWWLPAANLRLEDAWDGDTETARVGEPLTRQLRLRADGVRAAQLPDIDPPEIDGLAIYADDPEATETVGDTGLAAEQTLALAVIPERPGRFEWPPLRVGWFDVEAGTARSAELPARTITVLPAAGASGASTDGSESPSAPGSLPASTPAPDASDAGASALPTTAVGDGSASAARWRALALAAVAGWALTAIALWRLRRAGPRAPEPPDTGSGTAAFDPDTRGSARALERRMRAAARCGDARALVRALLERAALVWPDDPPRSLAALAGRLDRATLAGPLAALDAALYGRRSGGTAVDRTTLEALPALLERALADAAGERGGTAGRGGSTRPEERLPPL